MRYFLFLIFLGLGFTSCLIITRGSGRKEIRTKQLKYEHHENIFRDYSWNFPDVKSIPINIDNKDYNLRLHNTDYTISKKPDGTLTISSNEAGIITSTESISKGELYYDKSILGTKAIIRQRWVPHSQYVGKMVPVTKYRSVSESVWDNSTHGYRYSTHQQMYQDFEYRSTMETSYRWESYTDYVIDIPDYNYYSFALNDSTNIIVYHVNDNYYLQNASYLYAEDNDGLKYIFIDNNVNGNFTDPDDKVMFSSWNPYSQSSGYRKSLFLISNKWYYMQYLSEEYFLNFNASSGILNIDYKNDKYVNTKEKGTILFKNVPERSRFTINGKYYYLGNRESGYPSEFGMFKITIKQFGHLDMDTVITINSTNRNAIIKYKITDLSSFVEIKSIYSDGYFVNVTNDNGFHKTYYNTNKVEMPAGKNKIEILTDGITIEKYITVDPGKVETIDFEEELKKTIPPVEEQKETTPPVEEPKKE